MAGSQRPRILVADDEQGVRLLVRHQVEQLGCEVLEARDGSEARRILESQEVDVAITDLLMPGLDGLGLMRWAQGARPEMAWIVLSGLETFGTAVEAIQLGAFDFLTKPPEPERLRVSVRNALGSVVLERERAGLLTQLDQRNRNLRDRVEQLEVLCDVLENQAAEIDRDLERAETIQRALLPSRPPALGAFRVETLYRPGHHVGGDLYDVMAIDERYAGLLIADACGHGVSAAMLSVLFKQHLPLRDESSGDPLPPAFALAAANTVLVERAAPSLFVTAAYCLLDLETGEIDVASAGHPPILWCQGEGRVGTIERTGPALGVEAGAHYGEVRIQLERGDRLLLFTDGVLGVHGAGLARVREIARDATSLTSMLSALREGALAGENENELDDATAIALEARVGSSRIDQPPITASRPTCESGAQILANYDAHGAWMQVIGRGTWRDAESFLAFTDHAVDAVPRLVVDLGECSYLDSTFLGSIHEAVCLAQAEGCQLRLQGVGPSLQRQFEELSMDRVVERICEDAEPLPSGLRRIAGQASSPAGEHVLRAHEMLAKLSSRNRDEFRAVIQGLRAEIERH